VADHAIALMMTLAKSIAYHDEQLRTDLRANWRPAHNPFGRRLSACTFGVVGIGRIGTAAARRAKAFDMDVVFHDPYQPNGYELALTQAVASSVGVPVIASGGAGNASHALDVFTSTEADAVLVAGMLHDRTTSVGDIKRVLRNGCVAVRETAPLRDRVMKFESDPNLESTS